MIDMSNEEDLKRLFKSVYPSVPAPIGFKECLGEHLSLEAGEFHGAGRSLLGRPKVWLPVTSIRHVLRGSD